MNTSIALVKGVHQVMFQSEYRTCKIQHLIDKTGHMKEVVLLIHVFLGCDTDSRMYGIGKGKITKSPKFVNICCNVAPIFYNHLSSKLDIQEGGEVLLLGLCNRVNIVSLNNLRDKTFMEKVAGKSVVKPEQLPPTKDSSKYHFFRVFHQIQTWLGCPLNPLEWGWKVQNDKMVTMFTNQIPVPSELLTYVKCGCKGDGYGALTCSWKKHGKAFSCFLSNLLSSEFSFVARVNL